MNTVDLLNIDQNTQRKEHFIFQPRLGDFTFKNFEKKRQELLRNLKNNINKEDL